MFQSQYFYMRVKGDYALFTEVSSKGGGEKVSYSVPTKQSLIGIVDANYFKPTITNEIEEVKVINPIQTEVIGTRALLNSGKADLNYVSYLKDVEYFIKFYFTWNENRPDLKKDRNVKKHEAITKRSLKKGGRRDAFIGTRECVAEIEWISEDEYNNTDGFYKDQILSFGIMFHSFRYPSVSGEPLKSYFTDTIMKDSIIRFKPQEECEIENELSNYSFKDSGIIKDVNEEYNDYENMENS